MADLQKEKVGAVSTPDPALEPDLAAPVGEEAATASRSDLEREIDRLSLDQALRDFEIANSRVIDLTQRLIGAINRADVIQRELDVLRADHAVLQADHHAVVTSKAYRLAERIRVVRNLVR